MTPGSSSLHLRLPGVVHHLRHDVVLPGQLGHTSLSLGSGHLSRRVSLGLLELHLSLHCPAKREISVIHHIEKINE